MEVNSQYPNTHEPPDRSDSPLHGRAGFLDDVIRLRTTATDMVVISTVRDRPDAALRFTLRNGASFLVDVGALRWLFKENLKNNGGDPLPALAAILARKVFRSCGGKRTLGVSFHDWMKARV